MGLDRAAQAAAKLAELSGATPAQAAAALDNFDAKDVIGALAVASGGQNGGSQPLTVTKVPFAFDTEGLIGQPGIEVYVPSPGEVLLLGAVSVLTTFDGDQPTGYLQFAGQSAGDGVAIGIDLTTADAAIPGTGAGSTINKFADHIANAAGADDVNVGWFTDATALRFYVDDGGFDTGDPGSTEGTGQIVVVTLTLPD